MGKAQRLKGHDWERRVVRELKEINYPARRILEYQEENANGVDVDCGVFKIQCKKGKSIGVKAAYKEIKLEGIKVLVANWDRDVTLACLSWDDFKVILEWLKEANIQ